MPTSSSFLLLCEREREQERETSLLYTHTRACTLIITIIYVGAASTLTFKAPALNANSGLHTYIYIMCAGCTVHLFWCISASCGRAPGLRGGQNHSPGENDRVSFSRHFAILMGSAAHSSGSLTYSMTSSSGSLS